MLIFASFVDVRVWCNCGTVAISNTLLHYLVLNADGERLLGGRIDVYSWD